tara:strand:- start:1795 stop:2421 length:627 start_codon:yes stop_codon:yes gene_type:complete
MAHSYYIDKGDLKTYLGLSGSGQDTNLDNAINSASRLIDKITDRYFYQDATVNARFYNPTNEFNLYVDDISTTTGLVVKLDTTDDGTHEKTLTLDTDFILKPLNPTPYEVEDNDFNAPFTELQILATRSSERFDPLIMRNVKIEAKFGYPAIPEAIKQATLLQATRLFKRKDTPFNVFGNEATGTQELFSKFDPDARELIKGYIKRSL